MDGSLQFNKMKFTPGKSTKREDVADVENDEALHSAKTDTVFKKDMCDSASREVQVKASHFELKS